jgi:HEAT repeat protein
MSFGSGTKAKFMIDYPIDTLSEQEDEIALLDIEDDLDSTEDFSEDFSDVWVDEPVAPKPDPDEMLALLNSAIPSDRILAARAFCEIQDARAIDRLIELINDPCPLTRVAVAYALGRNPRSVVVKPLIHQLQVDWNGYVRKGIVWALGNCQDLQIVLPLIHALKTDIPAVRLWAASSLAQVGDLGYEVVLAAIPPLIEAMLGDDIAAVRSNCAWSIGRLCLELPANVVYATAVDALIEIVADDPELGVRADAKAALLKLGDPRGIQAIEMLEADG